MEDFDEFLQDPVGMEGEIFVISLVGRIASIYLLVLVCLELGIRSIFLAKAGKRLVRRMVVFHQPEIGIFRLFEYRFKTQRHGSAIRIMAEQVIGSGILVKLAGGAATSRYIPRRTAFHFTHQFRLGALRVGYGFQFVVALFHFGKDTVRQGFLSEKHSIETDPLGTSEGRCFHVVGTFDDRDFQLLHLSVASAILVRRKQQGIRVKVDNLLHIRIGAFPCIDDGSLLASFDDGRYLDVLDFANAPDAVHGSQFVDEVAMRSGIDQRLAQRSADNRSCGQMFGHFLVLVYQKIGAEDSGRIPRIPQTGFRIAFALNQGQVFGIFHGDDFTDDGRSSLVLPATSGEKHDEGCYLGNE